MWQSAGMGAEWMGAEWGDVGIPDGTIATAGPLAGCEAE